jgi:radical SAM superfamily enzyme YgiQ (UPF0313 family)
MNTLLINSNVEFHPWPVIPLGLCHIASTLKANGHCVKFVDLSFEPDIRSALGTALGEFQADAIGISIRNIDNANHLGPVFYLRDIRANVVAACQELSRAPIILGGSAIGIAPEQIMDYCGVDFAVAGEGEGVILDWLEAVERRQESFAHIPGLFFRRNDGTIQKPSSMRHGSLNPYLHPRPYEWIDFKRYQKRGAVANIQTKRGCIFECVYCSYNVIEGMHHRLRDPQDVADEMEEWISAVGAGTFEFVDSVFNSPVDHAIDLCEAIIRRKVNVQLTTMGFNPGHSPDDLLKAMKAAGFRSVMCSPDVASPAMIENLRKNFTIEDLAVTMEGLRRFGLKTFWFFMLGGPGETRETVRETLDFCERHAKPEDVFLFTIGFRVYPQTELARIYSQENPGMDGNNLLYPSFYCSPRVSAHEILKLVHERAGRNVNFITMVDFEIYDFISKVFAALMPSHPPKNEWTYIPGVNRRLHRFGLWNWIHKRYERKHSQDSGIQRNWDSGGKGRAAGS